MFCEKRISFEVDDFFCYSRGCVICEYLFGYDRKEYFEIPWANLRAMVEPAMAERSVVEHREYFTKGRLLTSPAVSLTDSRVLTKDGEHVRYDYLVITTGHGSPSPRTRAEKINYYKGGQFSSIFFNNNYFLYVFLVVLYP